MNRWMDGQNDGTMEGQSLLYFILYLIIELLVHDLKKLILKYVLMSFEGSATAAKGLRVRINFFRCASGCVIPLVGPSVGRSVTQTFDDPHGEFSL